MDRAARPLILGEMTDEESENMVGPFSWCRLGWLTRIVGKGHEITIPFHDLLRKGCQGQASSAN